MFYIAEKIQYEQFDNEGDHWERCKWLHFDNTNQWFTKRQKCALERESHKILIIFRDSKGLPYPGQQTGLNKLETIIVEHGGGGRSSS